ncbi:MAG: carboxymuconolactone decarboxylase family protein [Caulobacteraceae bacterium]
MSSPYGLAAERFGASQARIEALWSYQHSDFFTDAEKAAFDLALAGATQPSSIDDALITRVRGYWDEGELVELMGVISLFGFLNRWNDGMGTVIEPAAQDAGRRSLSAVSWRPGKHGADEGDA